jgi:hypothetical protein
VEMRQALLDKSEEMVESTQWPFVSKNLKSNKIFNDLYQYYFDSSLKNFGTPEMNNVGSYANIGYSDSKKQISTIPIMRNNPAGSAS